jgi:hypothetical protein
MCWVYEAYRMVTAVEPRGSATEVESAGVDARFGSEPQTLLDVNQSGPSISINILIN